jgi:hypothetical protein
MLEIEKPVGSALWGYETHDSDYDIRGLYTVTLEQRLDPINYQKDTMRRSTEVGYGTRKIEKTLFEFSTFVSKLWHSDINSWEVVAAHRIFPFTGIDRSVGDWGFRFLREHAFTYQRPNMLRDACIRQAEYFTQKAQEESNGKTACHAIKSLLIGHFTINPDAGYSHYVAGLGNTYSLLHDFRHMYSADFVDVVEHLTTTLKAITLAPDSEEFTDNWKRASYIKMVYKAKEDYK